VLGTAYPGTVRSRRASGGPPVTFQHKPLPDYFVVVTRKGRQRGWQWEIQWRPMPMGVKLCGVGFRTEFKARLAAQKALRALLEGVAEEQGSHLIAMTPSRSIYRRTAHFLVLRIAELSILFHLAGNACLPLEGEQRHGRSISSSRHRLCVRLLRRTARKDCESRYGLAPRGPILLQRVLRRRVRTRR
jgi:hypothetical protein